jgi:hypothetical protein
MVINLQSKMVALLAWKAEADPGTFIEPFSQRVSLLRLLRLLAGYICFEY